MVPYLVDAIEINKLEVVSGIEQQVGGSQISVDQTQGLQPLLKRSAAQERHEVCIWKTEKALDHMWAGLIFLKVVVDAIFLNQIGRRKIPGVFEGDVGVDLVDPPSSSEGKEPVSGDTPWRLYNGR